MINDKLVFPVTFIKTVEITFNVSARNEDEASGIVTEMYLNGELDNCLDDEESCYAGYTVDVGEVNLSADPEIDENGFIE